MSGLSLIILEGTRNRGREKKEGWGVAGGEAALETSPPDGGVEGG